MSKVSAAGDGVPPDPPGCGADGVDAYWQVAEVGLVVPRRLGRRNRRQVNVADDGESYLQVTIEHGFDRSREIAPQAPGQRRPGDEVTARRAVREIEDDHERAVIAARLRVP
jgi:hypothetical protein